MATPEKSSNRVLVSNTKRSIIFYVNLGKRMLTSEEEVELSGLGNAMSTVVNVAEIMKQDDCCEVTKITTSTVSVESHNGKKTAQRRLQIFVKKGTKFTPPPPRQERKPAEEAPQN